VLLGKLGGTPGQTCGDDQWKAYVQDLYDTPLTGTYDQFDNNPPVTSANDMIRIWKVGDPTQNLIHGDEQAKVLNFYEGSKFRFANDPANTVYTIQAGMEVHHHLNHYSYWKMWE
jgi:hypothetical protein